MARPPDVQKGAGRERVRDAQLQRGLAPAALEARIKALEARLTALEKRP